MHSQREEIFGYAYYLQKNYSPNTRFYFSDVGCLYSKLLCKVDYDLYCSQTLAIGMMYVKRHPASCEVCVFLEQYLYTHLMIVKLFILFFMKSPKLKENS